MSSKSSDLSPEIVFDPGPKYFASLYNFGKAVEEWGFKIPEYETEQIKGWVLGINGEEIEQELDKWSESGYLEAHQRLNQDTGEEHIIYRLENSEEARNFVSNIYQRISNEYNGQIEIYLEEHNEEDFEAFMDF